MFARRFRCLAAALSVIAMSFVCAKANATVVVPLTRADMIRRADMIVRVTVLGRQSRWNEDASQIITLTQLRVTRWIKGNAAQSVLVLRQLGGTVGNVRSQIAGDAELAPGRDAVLFLRGGGGGGVVYLLAMAQSAYFVEPSRGGRLLVRRNLDGLTLAMREGGALLLVEPGIEPGEPLDAFLASLGALARASQ